jgi:hypothetical protein
MAGRKLITPNTKVGMETTARTAQHCCQKMKLGLSEQGQEYVEMESKLDELKRMAEDMHNCVLAEILVQARRRASAACLQHA